MQMLQGKKTDLQKSLTHIHASKMFEMYVYLFFLPEPQLLCIRLCSEYIINTVFYNAVLGNG